MPRSYAYEQLRSLLQVPGVSQESRQVLGALWQGCRDKQRFFKEVQQGVLSQSREQIERHIQRLVECRCSYCVQHQENGRVIESALPPRQALVANAVNDEARRWMSDFLLACK